MKAPFSGSYLAQDVQFLLTRLAAVPTLAVAEKERNLQRGAHYSEGLSPETAPDAAYLQLFKRQLALQAPRLAESIYRLARHIQAQARTPEVVLVSLARAGTPIGVLLKRTLHGLLGVPVKHYSVSILRDRGLDLNALAYICERHADEALVFVDGWTGKGVIGAELRRSVEGYNLQHAANVCADLHVVADLAGTAEVSATREDYLLPSAILNATVSGLISRTVLTKSIGPQDFHGCLYLQELAPHDQSRYFVQHMWNTLQTLSAEFASGPREPCLAGCASNALAIAEMVEQYRVRYELPDRNFVKPGVGEATRVMLRRVPQVLVLQDTAQEAVAHLVHLATQKNVPVVVDPLLPCRALALIEHLD